MTDGTWDGFVSPNWNEPAGPVGSNWNGGTGNAPDGTASFPDNNYGRYNIVFTQATTTIQQLVFGSTKPYTFTIGGGSSADYQYFIIAGNGISTGAATIPTFVTTLYGELEFTNGATAGNAIINSGGQTAFKNTSTANQATITTTAAQSVAFFDSSNAGKATILVSSLAGSVLFFNNSTAANAQIQVTSVNGDAAFNNSSNAGNASLTINNSQSFLSFASNSTAQNATITDFGNTSFAGSSNGGNATINVENHGSLQFTDTSSVQNAIITIAALGSVTFNKSSTGGTGGITNLGSMDFSNHAAGIFSLGSISGDGLISFGTSGVQLHISGISASSHSLAGGDQASGSGASSAAAAFTDTISGVISGNGGITMDAQGTLTLSAANTYTGDTDITNGTLELAVGGSIAGNFDFQNASSTTATLKLDAANQIAGTVNGYGAGDTIDFSFHTFATGDHAVWTQNGAGGTLSLDNSAGTVVSSLNLTGTYTSAQFNIASDGHGGTMFAQPAANAINDLITELYVGYYNRAPDPSGENYWVTQLAGGMSLSAIAQSYSVQTESTALYPFLASPNTASMAAIDSFIAAIYQNLFGRAPDAAGQTYYVQQLQNGQNTVGGTIIAIESGAQGNDLLVLANKLTVGDYFDTQIFNNNVQFSQSVALAALAAVTSSASSVTTAEALVNTYVATAPHAAQAATASQAEVGLVGISPSHDLAIAA